MSTEQQLLDNVENLLRTLTVANGFQSDAGLMVFRNQEYQTQPPDRPCLLFFPGDTTMGTQGEVEPSLGEQNNFIPFAVEGFIDDDERGTVSSALRADLARLILANDTFGGIAEGFSGPVKVSSEILPGGEGGVIGFVRLEAVVFYVTPWGQI